MEPGVTKKILQDKTGRQDEMRRRQLERDRGVTFGTDNKDPCKKEKDISLACLDKNVVNSKEECKDSIENYKICKKFWYAVQEYRCMTSKVRKNELPTGEEYDRWKAQLPQWLVTNKITPPSEPAKESSEKAES